MNLLKLNNYIPPNPSSYDIDYSDVNGEETKVEDGTTYIEQVREDVPQVKVSWTNLSEEDVTAITNEISGDTVEVQYYYGTMLTATMTKSSRSLKLKNIDSAGNTYWNLSVTLKG